MNNSVKNVNNFAKIVITGGPCGGKSEALAAIQSHFSMLGWTVLIVPETATALITNGVSPWTCSSNYKYHEFQMELHAKSEEIFSRAAQDMLSHKLADKILLVFDRGQPDVKAYLSEDDYESINRMLLTDGMYITEYDYDAVFHLETAAKNFPQFYTTENNQARKETIEEAVNLDNETFHAWDVHPYRYLIPGQEDFKKKICELIEKVECFLRFFENLP